MADKPKKPYPDFPLFPHATNRWAKKIKGKLHYFGPWRDPDGALEKYLSVRDDLHAGRTPRPDGGVTVRELLNRFLTSKHRRVATGDLSPRTFPMYRATCGRLDARLGNRPVEGISPEDFDQLRTVLSQGRGPYALGNEIRHVRMVFKYAYDAGLIDRPVNFGPHFTLPTKRLMRLARAATGLRMLEADELRSVLASSSGVLEAMILLGVNCGFGQTDIANLTLSSIDLNEGWIEHPRPKTGVHRRCPLWPETVKAVRIAIDNRPQAVEASDNSLAFLTARGLRWVRPGIRGAYADSIGPAFSRLLTDLGLKREKLSFYALRHTFETIAGESKDQVAVNAVMGHADTSMAATYRERISDERLQDVVGVVRAWLWPEGM